MDTLENKNNDVCLCSSKEKIKSALCPKIPSKKGFTLQSVTLVGSGGGRYNSVVLVD